MGEGGGRGIQKMTLADREGGGGLRRPKKDDVIYEQPLTEAIAFIFTNISEKNCLYYSPPKLVETVF